MFWRVILYYVAQAFYDMRVKFGFNQVLLTDPRWKDEFPVTDINDYYGLF